MLENEEAKRVRLIVVGNANVGKSTFVRGLLEGKPNKTKLIASPGSEWKEITVTKQNQEYKISLCDTAGTERFRSISQNYVRGSHGAFVMFDAKSSSMEDLFYWKEFLTSKEESIEWILLKTKSDLGENGERNVDCTRFASFAHDKGKPFFEVSSFEYKGVQESLNALLDQIIESGRLEIFPERGIQLSQRSSLATQSAPGGGWCYC